MKKITVGLIAVFVLVFAFYFGGNAPELNQEPPEITEFFQSEVVSEPPAIEKTKEIPKTEVPLEEVKIEEEVETYNSASVETPVIEPHTEKLSDNELTCTLSVRCDTILENMDWLKPEKIEFVPKDGVIFAEKTVIFYEGESVFNILMREMKQNKIHMEFENTPVYNSAYIEGINNLYEFDCGELSGWMYKVNGWFPNFGCSRYTLKPGDKVEFVYTCDLGKDVGNEYRGLEKQRDE